MGDSRVVSGVQAALQRRQEPIAKAATLMLIDMYQLAVSRRCRTRGKDRQSQLSALRTPHPARRALSKIALQSRLVWAT